MNSLSSSWRHKLLLREYLKNICSVSFSGINSIIQPSDLLTTIQQRFKWTFWLVFCSVVKPQMTCSIRTCFCWSWARSHWLLKHDKWDIPHVWNSPTTRLGSPPESLCRALICRSRPHDSQITTIKHLKTELGLDWRIIYSQQWWQLHPSQQQRRTATVWWNVEASPENCEHQFHFLLFFNGILNQGASSTHCHIKTTSNTRKSPLQQ